MKFCMRFFLISAELNICKPVGIWRILHVYFGALLSKLDYLSFEQFLVLWQDESTTPMYINLTAPAEQRN